MPESTKVTFACDPLCDLPGLYAEKRELAEEALRYDEGQLETMRHQSLKNEIAHVDYVVGLKELLAEILVDPRIGATLPEEEQAAFAERGETVVSKEEMDSLLEDFMASVNAQRELNLARQIAEHIDRNPWMTTQEVAEEFEKLDAFIEKEKASEGEHTSRALAAQRVIDEEMEELRRTLKPRTIEQVTQSVQILREALDSLSPEVAAEACRDCPGPQYDKKRSIRNILMLEPDDRILVCPNRKVIDAVGALKNALDARTLIDIE